MCCDYERMTVIAADVVNGADMRMIERAGCTRLALESLQCLGSLPRSSGKNLRATARLKRVSSAL